MYESLYRYWRYRYPYRTKLTEVSGTGVNFLSNLRKCPVPVLMSFWAYRSFPWWYWCGTEPTDVSGIGNTGGIDRLHDSVRTGRNTLLCVCCSKGTLWIINGDNKWKRAECLYLLTLNKTNNFHFLAWFLWQSDYELHFLVQSQKQISFVEKSKQVFVRNRKGKWIWYSGLLLVCSSDFSAVQLGFWT